MLFIPPPTVDKAALYGGCVRWLSDTFEVDWTEPLVVALRAVLVIATGSTMRSTAVFIALTALASQPNGTAAWSQEALALYDLVEEVHHITSLPRTPRSTECAARWCGQRATSLWQAFISLRGSVQ